MRAAVILMAGLALAACARPASAPIKFNTTLPTSEVMARIINPAASALWDSAGELDTDKGVVSKLPTSDEGWNAAENNAAIIAEAGNLLLLPGRVRKLDPKDDDWSRYAHEMIDDALADKRAIAGKDGAKMLDAGAKLYDSGCMDCHQKYLTPFMKP